MLYCPDFLNTCELKLPFYFLVGDSFCVIPVVHGLISRKLRVRIWLHWNRPSLDRQTLIDRRPIQPVSYPVLLVLFNCRIHFTDLIKWFYDARVYLNLNNLVGNWFICSLILDCITILFQMYNIIYFFSPLNNNQRIKTWQLVGSVEVICLWKYSFLIWKAVE